ncbi:GGDEF domain-containing protein [Ectopseudomonas mendocina]|uniref:diguanylate cyclase n=1 Tax=Ectopseudomonas mendocina TaxID=300 RepID=A0ABZ2RE04_ECTME
MVTTVIISMLCVHLLCFSAMFLLISTRLNGKKFGMEVFALGSLLLGIAYILQVVEGSDREGLVNIINHTMTLCAPVAYCLGGMRFFGYSTPVLRPMLAVAVGYTLLQLVLDQILGPVARHVLLAGVCSMLFFGMTASLVYGRSSFAKDLRAEIVVFALLIGGICILNGIKFFIILDGGLEALNLSSRFQVIFYIYMSFLGTVLPPSLVWLVLRRLTDELRTLATHDPLTRLLNRRGMVDGLESHFRSRTAGKAFVLIVDVDHFKRINDTHGHKTGDQVLVHVANILVSNARKGDLVCRLGGEEFALIALDTDREGALQLAERARAAIEQSQVPGLDPKQPIRCTVTIGVSDPFTSAQALDDSLQQADRALYRGKSEGRNRVEWVRVG